MSREGSVTSFQIDLSENETSPQFYYIGNGTSLTVSPRKNGVLLEIDLEPLPPFDPIKIVLPQLEPIKIESLLPDDFTNNTKALYTLSRIIKTETLIDHDKINDNREAILEQFLAIDQKKRKFSDIIEGISKNTANLLKAVNNNNYISPSYDDITAGQDNRADLASYQDFQPPTESEVPAIGLPPSNYS